MSRNRFFLASLAVLVTKAAVGAIAFGLVFSSLGEDASPAFRPEGTERHGLAMLGYVAWSLAFTTVFARGFENRGWLEGIRFGLLVGFLYFVPMTLGIYGYFIVSLEWTGIALASGLAEALACGVAATLVCSSSRSPAGRTSAGVGC